MRTEFFKIRQEIIKRKNAMDELCFQSLLSLIDKLDKEFCDHPTHFKGSYCERCKKMIK